jgi:hypothetical protein
MTSPGLTLCLDPGETVGWAVFNDGILEHSGQFKVDTTSLTELVMFVTGISPARIVMENYRVYGHKTEQHAGSEVVTIQYIGIFKLIAEQMHIPVYLQMAWQAKGFATDSKLKAWGMYQVAHKHANDAIRHGVYFYLFHKV